MAEWNKPREWGDLKALQARYPGVFGRTRAYALLAQKKLRAKKFGKKTLWDLSSADELIEALPSFGEER